MKIALIIVAAFVLALILWRLLAVSRPAHPPLAISEDDPDMNEAMKKAQQTVAEFRQLYAEYPKDAMVKVPFFTSSGDTEYLTAEVLEMSGNDVKVRLSTPPVTHTGRVERLRTYPLSEIVDWVIVMPDDKRKGGFTMRVMFKKAREQWGKLPPELAEEEKKYE